MAHNPKRPDGLDATAVAKIEAEVKRQHAAAPTWLNLQDLSILIANKSRMGKPTVLSPWTAGIVAAKLAEVHEKPTRDEIALMICNQGQKNRCKNPCYGCTGKANIIVSAYGCRMNDRQIRKV